MHHTERMNLLRRAKVLCKKANIKLQNAFRLKTKRGSYRDSFSAFNELTLNKQSYLNEPVYSFEHLKQDFRVDVKLNSVASIRLA